MDNAGERTASGWLDQNMDAIVAFSIQAGAVAYQGARIDDATNQLKPGAPRDIALAQLHEELREEYAAMLVAQHALPDRDEFEKHIEAAEAARTAVAHESSALVMKVNAAVHEVEDAVDEAAVHVPAAEQQLMAYMQQQIARIIGRRGVEQSWHEYNAAETVEAYAGALAMMSYMPVPDHLSPEEREEITQEVIAGIRLAERAREQPLDIHALAEAVRKANPEVESQGLSTLAALILLQDPGQRFTAAKIGSELYPGDDPARAANKVGALLYHSLEGRRGRAGRILAENGYRLVRATELQEEQADQQEQRHATVYGIVPIE